MKSCALTIFLLAVAVQAGKARPAEKDTTTGKSRAVSISSGLQAGDQSELPILDDNSSLNDYLQYAALNNPGLKARFEQWKAAEQKAPQAKALPDPTFSYTYFIRDMDTGTGPQQRFGLMQMFPWFGKLSLKESIARREAGQMGEQFLGSLLDLRYRVQTAWYDYYYLARSIDVTRENFRLLESIEEVARVRYTASTLGYPMLLKTQVELGRLENDLKSLDNFTAAARQALNSALGRDPGSPLGWPGEIVAGDLGISDDSLRIIISTTNPEIKALDLATENESAGVELARKEYYPDLTFGLEHERNALAPLPSMADPSRPETMNMVMATVSINLPFFNLGKYRAAEREAVLRLSSVRQERHEMLNRLNEMFERALFDYRDAGRQITLYRDALIPKAEQTLETTRSVFTAAGMADFLDLLDAQRMLIDLQLGYEKAVVDRGKSLAEIERLTGLGLAEVSGGN